MILMVTQTRPDFFFPGYKRKVDTRTPNIDNSKEYKGSLFCCNHSNISKRTIRFFS